MSTVALDAVSVAQDSKHEKVVEAARALVPFLREQQGESDRLGRTPDETAARLQAAGVYSLTTPRAYGGLQTNLTTWMKVITEIGRGDGGVAWGASLINSCNMFGAYFPREVGEEVFAKPGTRLSGVPMPRKAKTKRVEGGILIEEGMWMFNSGVYQAHWDLLGVPMVNEAGQVIDHVMAVVPMSDVKILDDWDTIGLRGSGSSSISVENVFVPDARLLSLPKIAAGANDGPFKDESLYKSAMVPVMAIILAFPALGLGMHMLEATIEAMKGKNIAYTAYVNQMEAPVTHLQVGEANAKIDCAQASRRQGVRGHRRVGGEGRDNAVPGSRADSAGHGSHRQVDLGGCGHPCFRRRRLVRAAQQCSQPYLAGCSHRLHAWNDGTGDEHRVVRAPAVRHGLVWHAGLSNGLRLRQAAVAA